MEQETFSTSNENRYFSFAKRVRPIRHVKKVRDAFQSSQYHFAKTSSKTTIVKFEGSKRRT